MTTVYWRMWRKDIVNLLLPGFSIYFYLRGRESFHKSVPNFLTSGNTPDDEDDDDSDGEGREGNYARGQKCT